MVLFLLLVLAVCFLVETILIETENFGWATFTLVLVGGLVQGLHLFNILKYVKQNTAHAIAYVLAYFLVGFVWSFIKWFFFLMNQRELFRNVKRAFLTKRGLNPIGQVPNEMQDEFRTYLSQTRNVGHRSSFSRLERPKANENKSRIIAWMSFWPFSFLGTLINDPIRRFFTLIFDLFKVAYQKLADSIFSKDMELK